MKVKISRINVPRTRAGWPDTEFNPAFILNRNGDKRKWLVADAPISADAPILWADSSIDEYVRIPIFKYDMVPQGDLALAFMFKLGLICAGQLGEQPRHLYIVTGEPTELVMSADDTPQAMRGWLGFAVSFED
jgi:hypothetical protein